MVNCVVMTRMFTCCVYCGVLAMMNCAYLGAFYYLYSVVLSFCSDVFAIFCYVNMYFVVLC